MRENWRKQAIAKLLEEYNLVGEKEVETLLLEHAEVALQFEIDQEENYAQVGNSRIAGQPDLPPSIKWPITEDGEAYTLLAQINLSELPLLPTDYWPSSGMLYFFLGLDEPAYDIDHKVFYYDGDLTDLTLTSLPEGLEEINGEERDFISHRVTWHPHLSLPDLGEATEILFDDYDELETEINGVSDALGGGIQTWAGDTQLDAYLCKNGLDEFLFKTSQLPKKAQEDAIQGAQNWQMLFSLSSLHEVNMCWWDAGYLEFLIHIDDLKEGRFNNTYVNLATS